MHSLWSGRNAADSKDVGGESGILKRPQKSLANQLLLMKDQILGVPVRGISEACILHVRRLRLFPVLSPFPCTFRCPYVTTSSCSAPLSRVHTVTVSTIPIARTLILLQAPQ